AANEIKQLFLQRRGCGGIGRDCNSFHSDVIADSGLNGMSRIKFEHDLHLIESQSVEIHYPIFGKVGNCFDKRIACYALIDRAAIERTDIIDEAEKYFFNWPPRESFKIQRPKRLACAVRYCGR